MGKLIGIYGGTFDPIHLGHLNLATEMMEIHALDEVWFCPAGCNPHKKNHSSASAFHRLNMINLAIAEEPRFRVSEIELNREGLSYTIDTLNELHTLQKNQDIPASFALILGEDSARDFYQWYRPEEIVRLAKLLVGKRKDLISLERFQGSPIVVEALNRGITPTRVMEISSKEIRQRLLNKRYCYHLVPGKVMDYIITNHLYYIPLNEAGLNEARFL